MRTRKEAMERRQFIEDRPDVGERALAQMMKRLGMYARSTQLMDIVLGIRRVRDAKRVKIPCGTLDGLALEHLIWARQTFPDESAEDQEKHLEEEVEELLKDTNCGEEFADVFFMLLSLADSKGIDLLAEGWKKLGVNKARKWNPETNRHQK